MPAYIVYAFDELKKINPDGPDNADNINFGSGYAALKLKSDTMPDDEAVRATLAKMEPVRAGRAGTPPLDAANINYRVVNAMDAAQACLIAHATDLSVNEVKPNADFDAGDFDPLAVAAGGKSRFDRQFADIFGRPK